MAVERKKQVEQQVDQHKASIGTWFSLGIVGAVILGTYLLMFGIFMARV
ncbi:hypothetical protein LGQ02_11145 [Bacillus shivajii]|nr:hypothetical protein [Bacillus shivajii]UCZ51435.1 hypothetical protein LGQ02_11145 [Bacillus shivajii]